jgi:hypothetical protein
MTQVAPTAATTADGALIRPLHDALPRKRLLPAPPLVAAGEGDAALLVASRRADGVDRLGPTPATAPWPAREARGFAIGRFVSDWPAQQATGPAGRRSQGWTPSQDQHGHDVIQVRFATGAGRAGPSPQSGPVHAGALADADAPPAGPVAGAAGAAGRPATRTPTSLHGAIRPAGWSGRHSLARHARLRVAARPLHRAGENPSPAPAHGGGQALRARGALVNRDSSRKHPAIALCRVAGASRLMCYLAAICQQYHTWEGLL